MWRIWHSAGIDKIYSAGLLTGKLDGHIYRPVFVHVVAPTPAYNYVSESACGQQQSCYTLYNRILLQTSSFESYRSK